MKLFEMFRRGNKVVAEGGNVSSQSPGWQGAADQAAEEIDLKIHDRDFMVGQLRTLLSAQNESFKAAYGKYIWEPKLLKSGQMFSGSSLTFFDVKGVTTQDFINKLKKTKVGDIDTQIDQDMGDEVTAWLKSIIGKKVGNGTFLGFNSSLSSIWLLDDPQVRIQVDYELGPYDPQTKSPTEWFAYSHSSSYDDMAAGIKGVFHKYINRAMTHSQASEKYVARVLKKGVKFSDAPVVDSDYSFAVSGGQGGGMSKKYKPYIDPNTGEPMMKDGIPVMQQLDPKDRDYIQNLDQQFMINFGRNRTAADKNLQNSFVGTLQLMNKSFTPEQNEAVARAFLDILFGAGAQMITKDDPERDRDTKFAAVDAMLLGGDGIKPLNLSNGAALRQEAVKMAMDYADKFNAKRAGKTAQPDTEVAEDADAAAAAKPNYARQGIKHLYNRLPDGRVSSAEMKNADFLEIAKEIANNGGTLNGLPISLKVDGAGIRFGKDASGRPFFMTSKVTTPLYQDDVGYFTSFGQEKGQDAEQLARTKKYDDALALITGSKFIQALPSDTIVQAEMMYNPMAQQTDQGLKFVNIPYDPKKLGKQMTLVPFVFKQYSTGDERPDADKIKKRLLASSDSNIKIVSNNLEQKGINVSKIIDPILNLDPKDKANIPAFDTAKQELSSAIIDNPKLAGKDALGDNMEGIVVNMPSGQMFKITSSQMKSVMAAKMSQPASKRQGPLKTAVVAIGSFAGHLGHEDLFNETINKAKELGGDPYLFIGNAVGADDPIPTDVKVQTWHKLYPQYANNIGTVMQGGSLMQKIKHELINPVPGKPPKYDNIVIMVGEDRANMPLAGALMKAVTKFPGYEHVKVSLETIPRTRPISFTKLRNILKDPNATPEQQYDVWAGGFNEQKLGKDWILHLMDITRKGMGVTQQPAARPVPQPVAEQRLFNALIRPTRKQGVSEGLNEDAARAEAQASYMQGQCMVLAVAINQLDPKRYPIGYVWEYNMSAGAADVQLDDDEWEYLSPEEQEEVSKDISRHSVVHAYVRDQETNEYIDARGRHKDLPNLWGKLGQTRFEEFPGTARELIDITAHGDWDEVGEKVSFKRGQPAFDSLAGPAGIKRAQEYAVKYLGVEGSKNKLRIGNIVRAVVDGKRVQGEVIGISSDHEQVELWLSGVNDFNPVTVDVQDTEVVSEQDVAEGESRAMAQAARRLTDPKDGATAKLRAAGDKRREDDLKSRNIAKKNEAILPKSAFAGTGAPTYHKLGPAAQAKGKQKGPVKRGQLVGSQEESAQHEDKIKGVDGKACWKGKRYAGKVKKADGTYKDKCVPVSENVENIMTALIDRIIVNEAISHNKR